MRSETADAMVRTIGTPKKKWHAEAYQVMTAVMTEMLSALGCPTPAIDAFADPNHHCFQRWWGPGGEKEDAFAQSWDKELRWCNPPFSCLDRVVVKAIAERANIVLVCPDWQRQAWWWAIKNMSKHSILCLKVQWCFCMTTNLPVQLSGAHGHTGCMVQELNKQERRRLHLCPIQATVHKGLKQGYSQKEPQHKDRNLASDLQYHQEPTLQGLDPQRYHGRQNRHLQGQ